MLIWLGGTIVSKQDSSFFVRRLHSLLGVVPLGVFLVQHLIINNFATRGPEAFNTAAGFMGNLPFVLVLETFVIYLPILFHGIYGVYIAFTAKNNVGRYGTYRNWMFLMQRITGIIAFVFIAIHVYQTRFQVLLGAEVNFDIMADILGSPFWFVFYVVGVLAVVFHFANGLWSFMITWGITQSPKSQQIMSYVAIIVFVIVGFIGVQTLFAFI